MKRGALLLLPLFVAGCASERPPVYAPVKNMRYGAISHDPFWLVSIGDDRIVLTTGPAGGRADGELDSYEYPRPLPTVRDGVRRWESGQGTAVISVEARQGPCSTGGHSYQDRVKVYLSGRMMEGCGGYEIPAGRRG